MSIDFACPTCRQALRSDDAHAGLATRCPSCGTLSTIPTLAEVIPEGIQTSLSSALESQIVREPTRRPGQCPECSKAMQDADVLCVECGYDRRMGRQRSTRV